MESWFKLKGRIETSITELYRIIIDVCMSYKNAHGILLPILLGSGRLVRWARIYKLFKKSLFSNSLFARNIREYRER